MRLGERVAYASGNFGKSTLWNSMEFLFLFYLVDLIGIPVLYAGIVMLTGLVWDGLCGPLLGRWVDRRQRVYRTYPRLLLMVVPICATSFLAVFLLPALVAGLAFPLALAGMLLFRTSYALVDIPHNAMLASLTLDPRERSTIAALRYMFSALGTIGISMLAGLSLLQRGSGAFMAALGYAGVVAILYLVVMLGCALGSPQTPPAAAAPRGSAPALARIAALLRSGPFVLLLGFSALSASLVPIFGKLTLFYARTWLGDGGAAPALLLAYSISQIALLPVWLWIAARTEKRIAGILACAALVLATAAFAIVAPRGQLAAIGYFVLAGGATGGIYMLGWAILPDTVEYHQAATGVRDEGLIVGIFLLVLKLGSGLGIGLVALSLAAIGYQPQTMSSPSRLLVAEMGLLPMAGALGSMLLLWRMRISYVGHALRVRQAFGQTS